MGSEISQLRFDSPALGGSGVPTYLGTGQQVYHNIQQAYHTPPPQYKAQQQAHPPVVHTISPPTPSVTPSGSPSKKINLKNIKEVAGTLTPVRIGIYLGLLIGLVVIVICYLIGGKVVSSAVLGADSSQVEIDFGSADKLRLAKMYIILSWFLLVLAIVLTGLTVHFYNKTA